MTHISEKTFQVRGFYVLILVVCVVALIFVSAVTVYVIFQEKELEVVENEKLNVLFIVVDDLRPALGCYGDKKAITPNIDQLAAKSILFSNAFAQQALCAPSRTSFLTSRRPDSLHLYNNLGKYWRESVGNFTTLPEHFKNNGYETISIGKIFHNGAVSNKTDDYPYSWSQVPYHPPTLKEKMAKVCPSPNGDRMNLFCPVDVEKQPGKSLPDIQITDYAINYLKNRSQDSLFFLGLGFYKPHIPFKFPKEYLDLYPFDEMDLAEGNTKPENMPNVSWNPWTDLRERDDVKDQNISFPFGPIPNDFQKSIRQGYYASLSYMDDQLGKVLQALEENGYGSNTIIVFFGDHGWSLGEHGEWAKYSNFEVSLKVPLLMYIPKLTENQRIPFQHIKISKDILQNYVPQTAKYVSDELIELVDLFPTLSEIARLPVPYVCPVHSSNITFCSEGVSFYPAIKSRVSSFEDFDWKRGVFSQYPRPSENPQQNSDQSLTEDIQIMGYTLRTHYFRYTRWVRFNNTGFNPFWSKKHFVADELYDQTYDSLELNNLVYDSDYANTVIHLYNRLKKGWRHALPKEIFGS